MGKKGIEFFEKNIFSMSPVQHIVLRSKKFISVQTIKVDQKSHFDLISNCDQKNISIQKFNLIQKKKFDPKIQFDSKIHLDPKIKVDPKV